jgi:hypothetical protein
MTGSENSRRNAIAMSIGWWYLRRMIRKRGKAAVAGVLAGEGLSLAGPPRRRHPIRWLLVLSMIAVGLFWWRRRDQGGDDWGDWRPAPVAPDPTDAAPAPDPLTADVVAT